MIMVTVLVTILLVLTIILIIYSLIKWFIEKSGAKKALQESRRLITKTAEKREKNGKKDEQTKNC